MTNPAASPSHPFVPTRNPVVVGGSVQYGPAYATEDEAQEWIRAYEAEHGFSGNSGWKVEETEY